jgi:hypothetical protein
MGEMSALTASMTDRGLNESDFFLFMPASVWRIIVQTKTIANQPDQIRQDGLTGRLQRVDLGFNILVVPDSWIPVEGGKYNCAFINRRALAMELRQPTFRVPVGFVDIIEANMRANPAFEGVSSNFMLPFLLYYADSYERLANDGIVSLAFNLIAGRVSDKGVFTIQFSTTPTAPSPAPPVMAAPAAQEVKGSNRGNK